VIGVSRVTLPTGTFESLTRNEIRFHKVIVTPAKAGSRDNRCGLAVPGFPLFAGMTTRSSTVWRVLSARDIESTARAAPTLLTGLTGDGA
jgi:hypothetical protein